jgi:beta-galactosidase/beta-glucuronidase
MRKIILLLTLLIYSSSIYSQADKVEVVKSSSGFKLKVNGKDFIINGMNWDYYPIGTNYSYSLWKQSDEVIMAALDAEMGLLKNMGVNTIRQYTGIQSKWITYIYQKYGIYTMINHSFGRYGLTLNGTWVPNTEYSNALTQQTLLKETKELVAEYKNTPGLLMFLLGNENNYGLFWDGAESENIPLEDRRSTVRAKDMYKLFNDAVVEMKKIDKAHPIAICNGDLLFLDIIAKECKAVDIIGTNMYRGVSFTDAFQKVKEKLDMPLMFTEFGADSFNT